MSWYDLFARFPGLRIKVKSRDRLTWPEIDQLIDLVEAAAVEIDQLRRATGADAAGDSGDAFGLSPEERARLQQVRLGAVRFGGTRYEPGIRQRPAEPKRGAEAEQLGRAELARKLRSIREGGYKCGQCGAAFSREDLLAWHLEATHGEGDTDG